MASGHFATVKGHAVWMPGNKPTGFKKSGRPSTLKKIVKGAGAVAAIGFAVKHKKVGAILRGLKRGGKKVAVSTAKTQRGRIFANIGRSETARSASGFNVLISKEKALSKLSAAAKRREAGNITLRRASLGQTAKSRIKDIVHKGRDIAARKSSIPPSFFKGQSLVKSSDDVFKTLNISSGASKKEANKAFIKAMKKWHPDVHRGITAKKIAEDKASKINEAYQIYQKVLRAKAA